MKPVDEQLINAFLAGERAAVEQIRGWLTEAVRGFRLRLAMPWEDVEQELLLEVTALLRRRAFRGEARLRTFLWRLAKYRCLNLLRDQRKPWLRDEAAADELKHQPTPERSPLDQVVARESADALVRLMAAVSTECRRLWTMIHQGRSYREMSQELDVGEGALRVRVLRCRRKATTLWQGWQG